MDKLSFDAFNLFSLCLIFCLLLLSDDNEIVDGTGDGVVSNRVIPSNNTCVLMSSLSGSSLNIHI